MEEYVPEDGSMFGLVAAAPGLPAREVLDGYDFL